MQVWLPAIHLWICAVIFQCLKDRLWKWMLSLNGNAALETGISSFWDYFVTYLRKSLVLKRHWVLSLWEVHCKKYFYGKRFLWFSGFYFSFCHASLLCIYKTHGIRLFWKLLMLLLIINKIQVNTGLCNLNLWKKNCLCCLIWTKYEKWKRNLFSCLKKNNLCAKCYPRVIFFIGEL